MKNIFKYLFSLNFKTIYFNLKYFPFCQAICLPVLISSKTYLKEVRGKCIIQSELKPGLIKIGFGNVGIFDRKTSRTVWEVSGTIIFGGKTNIGHGSKICVGNSGTLTINENFTITAESTIVCYDKIEFGRNCLLSWDILIMDTDLHHIKNKDGEIINSDKPVIIGDNVWIGCRNLILKGAKIPNGSVIGASSVISKELTADSSLYAGNPVRLIQEDISWEI
jgi:acetyltransferase-like isoleucine patch superfamily enzyme